MGSGGVGGAAERSVLIAGLPRSGTTWIANALARCEGVSLVHEPDNDRHHVHALAAKAHLGRHPVLGPGDRAEAYARLFRAAEAPGPLRPGDATRSAWARRLVDVGPATDVDRVMGDQPPARWPWRLTLARALVAPPRVDPAPERAAGTTRLVKSVHCGLAFGWLLDTLRPDDALVILRHPANVIGSWRDLGWDLGGFPWSRPEMWARHGPPDHSGPRRAPDTFIERGAWMFAILAATLLRSADEHELAVVDHGQVMDDPVPQLAALAARLGLTWTDEAAAWVTESDRPGEGYELQRVAAEQRERWRSRLAPEELAVVGGVLERFESLHGRWETTSAGPATPATPDPPARPIWTVGSVRCTESVDGWHGVEADVDGTPIRFEIRGGTRPADRVEAFLTAVAPLALAAGADLRTEVPVDDDWRQGFTAATEMLRPWVGAVAVPRILAPDAVTAPAASTTPADPASAPNDAGEPGLGAEGVGLCFTCGVDSFWTLLHGGDEVTHLLYVIGYDLKATDTVRVDEQVRSLEAIAEAAGIELVLMRSDLRQHPHSRHTVWDWLHGAALAGAGIAASDTVGRLIVPPTYADDNLIPWGSRPDLDHRWSVPGRLEVQHGASQLTRFDRVAALAGDPLVGQHLRVCWERLEPGRNCGRCEKCVRTMVMFATVGALDEVATFPRRDLAEAIADLAPLREQARPYWVEVRDLPLPPELAAAVDGLLLA